MCKITVDVMKKEVRISKSTYNASCRVGTPEYIDLQKILQNHPDYNLVVESRKTSNDLFKFLTFDYMEKYISSHDDDAKNVWVEYQDLRGLSENAKAMGAVSYTLPQMKEWFLDKYPEVRTYHEKREAARKKLAEQHKNATRKAS